MITAFVFNNGTSKLHLKPENSRDETYLTLFASGKVNLSLEMGKDKDITIVAGQAKTGE